MGDQDPKRDKGKEKASADEDAEIIADMDEDAEITADMVRELCGRSSWDGNNPAGASGEGSGAGNPGQDALRSGGSSFRGDHVFQLQTPASGSVPPMGSLQQAPPTPAGDDLGKNAWPFPFPPPPVLNQPEPTDVQCPECGGPTVCGCWNDQGRLQFSLRGNPAQNAPPPRSAAPVVNQLQASLVGQQHGGGALGGSSSLQAPASGSGNMTLQLQPRGFLQQGPPPPQLQPREFSPEAWEWGAKMARRIMAGRPGGSGLIPGNPVQNAPRSAAPVVNQPQASLMGQQHGGGAFSLPPAPPAFQHLRPGHQQPPRAPIPAPETRRCPGCYLYDGGRMLDHPRRHVCPCNVCCFVNPCRVCGHGSGQAAVPDLPPPPPPPVGTAVQQLPNQPAVDIRPVGQLGDAPGGYAAHLGHPVPPADQPGAGPDPDPMDEDLRCPACRHYPMPAKLQPRWHVCVCHACRSHGIFCSVCDFGP